MTIKIVPFLSLFLVAAINMHAMELSPEQKEAAGNWFKAHQERKRTWEIFYKTPAGIQCKEADILHEKNPSPETDLLVKQALQDAMRTEEFNDFLQAQSLELVLQKKLIETDKSRERQLIGTQRHATQYYGMEECYGTLPIDIAEEKPLLIKLLINVTM